MKKIVIAFLSLLFLLAACSARETGGTGEASSEDTTRVSFPISAEINGFAITPDGGNAAVQLTIRVQQVLEGEEAYQQIAPQGAEPPAEGKEYIVVSLEVTYEGGELETLDFTENYPASWVAARIHFNIPNENSNTEDVTSYLANPIWGHVLGKGESATGEIAFLQDIGNTQPLYFVGYNQVATFQIH